MGAFTANPGSGASAAPLPPLPDLSTQRGGGGAQGSSGPGSPSYLATILSGIAPVKSAVDQIMTACKQIVQSGSAPGSEQVCGQIMAMASSLLPLAAQNAMGSMGGAAGGMGGGGQQPGMGMGPGAGMGGPGAGSGGPQMLPPSGGPAGL